MIRLNQTLMLEEQLEQAMVQACDMQAAYELETAESDELQYMAALLEEKGWPGRRNSPAMRPPGQVGSPSRQRSRWPPLQQQCKCGQQLLRCRSTYSSTWTR